MNNRFIKKSILSLFFALASFAAVPAQAWPEVDHMNMCDTATQVARAYGGDFRGWPAHDNYVAYRTRAGYYLRNYCQSTKAPVGKVKASERHQTAKVLLAQPKSVRIQNLTVVKSFTRTVKYDLHADCARVDKLNSTGAIVQQRR